MEIEIELECAICGKSLNGRVKENWIKVDACESCLQEAREQGDESGYNRGIKDAEGN